MKVMSNVRSECLRVCYNCIPGCVAKLTTETYIPRCFECGAASWCSETHRNMRLYLWYLLCGLSGSVIETRPHSIAGLR